jgi:uncharacterized protein (DUF1684 family)
VEHQEGFIEYGVRRTLDSATMIERSLRMKEPQWQACLERERQEKDAFFAHHLQSPVPHWERESFQCLAYYPPDSTYRLELELHEHEEKGGLRMEVTGGGEQEYIRWGEFRFQIGGQEQALQAYKRDLGEERFFVPFRDATSGNETYGAGRYLDLDRSHYLGGGKWVLDFNEAYNPWCAYSDAYICPSTPPENWLQVPVYAGEKNYHKARPGVENPNEEVT